MTHEAESVTSVPVLEAEPQDLGGDDSAALLLRMRIGLVGLLAILIGLLVFIVVSALRFISPIGMPNQSELPPGITWEFSIYGWGEREVQQLIGPSDVAVGSDGTIWVCDPQRWQVLGFWPDGTYRQILHRGPGQMMPQVIAVDDEDRIYVGDTLSREIRVFNADNMELRSWATSMPTEIAVRDGIIAVGTVGGLQVYDEAGKLIREWQGRGPREDQLDVVRGLAIADDGTIYVSDTHNQRLKAYDVRRGMLWCYPSGTAQRTASAETTAEGAGLFQLPVGMDFDAAGRLLVSDAFLFRMAVVNPKNGHIVEEHGAFGTEDGRFLYPASLAYDRGRDRVIVADTGNNRVQVLRVKGTGGGPTAALDRTLAGPVRRILFPVAALLGAVLAIMWLRELSALLGRLMQRVSQGRGAREQ